MRVDWKMVSELLTNKIDEKSERWNEVINTNVCISWYQFMLTR